MKLTFLLWFLSLAVSVCSGQTKTVSFQDLSGIVHSNVTIISVEKDGVLFRHGEEFKFSRVKFTNMSEEVRLQCGCDAETLQQQRDKKAEKERLARAKYVTVFQKQQAEEIARLAYLVRPIGIADFPKTDSSKITCKELVAELKGVNTGLELGVSFNKFSELFTDTAIRIQKTRDLSKDALPAVFKIRMDECIEVYNKSRNDWRKSIETESEEVKGWRNYFMREAWAESGIHLTMLRGIVDSQTNANELVINQAIDIVKSEKRAFDEGVLPNKLRNYKAISLLSEDEILKRLKENLADATLQR